MSHTPSLDTSDFYHFFIIINYHFYYNKLSLLLKITCHILFLLTNNTLLRFAFSSRRIWKESLRNYEMYKNLLICINVRHLNIFLMLFLRSFYFSDIFCSFTLMHSPRLPGDLHSIAWILRRSVSCVILRKYCAVQYDIHSSGFITPAHHFGLPVKNRSLIVTLNCELCTEKF